MFVVVIGTIGYVACCWIPLTSIADLLKGLCSVLLLLSLTMVIDRGGGSFGEYTFTIYMLSLPVQNVAEFVLAKLGTPWISTTIAMMILGIFIPLAIALVVKVIERKWKYHPMSRCIGL